MTADHQSAPPVPDTFLDPGGRRHIAIENFGPAVAHPEKAWHCVMDALDAGFPHLNWTQIDKPPAGMFDATMVRQIGFYIFCVKLGVPKRRAVTAARMTADAKWRAFNRIHKRMETLAFRRHVEAITEDAKQRIEEMLAR